MQSFLTWTILIFGLAQIVSARSISSDEDDLLALRKRSVEFMGMRVSYPQYLRLIAIQREVIKMDQTIRAMVRSHDPMELAENPHWLELLELYNSLKKMLPPDYLASVGDINPMPI